MKIITTTELNEKQKQRAFAIWDAEYPARLQMPAMADLDAFLNPLVGIRHYLLYLDGDEVAGWAATFSVESVRCFFIMVDGARHGKGYGTILLNELKKNETQLFGWVIDHNNDVKINGEPYPSPLNFYLKNNFTVNPELRLENDLLSAINIVWTAADNQQQYMINTIIFDLGAVLIDWNPHYLYRNIFADEEEMKHFLGNITTSDWNEEQDAGRPLQEGTEILVKQFPEHEANIRAFYSRWEEMLGEPFYDTVEIFKRLKESGKCKIYALTNWSAETFPVALARYDFLSWFDGIVVSGAEKMRKPTPAFYQILLDRHDVKPEEALFIDDNYRNILAAEKIGIKSIHFTSADKLRRELEEMGIL